MKPHCNSDISFVRLTAINPKLIAAHMSDPRVRQHMPLLTSKWDEATATDFVARNEERWRRDGLGHWAILYQGTYTGWGGFEKEGDEWDFGLVLKPEFFGLGFHIARLAIDFAKADGRISQISFLLPVSRRNTSALERLGARRAGEAGLEGIRFTKFRLETV